MDLLRKLYLVAAENIKIVREWQDPTRSDSPQTAFKVNDLVVVRDMTSGVFKPKYMLGYRIVEIYGLNRIVVRDNKGIELVRRASHLKMQEPKAKVVEMVPSKDDYCTFGRSTKLLLHTKGIPELEGETERIECCEILPNN